MAGKLSRLASALKSRGPGETLALVRKNLIHEFRWYVDGKFDREHGTRTAGIVELDKLGIKSGNLEQGVYYEATPTAIFHQLLRAVKADLSGYTYCDLGSGMGRTLLLASEYPFRRIVGVEFSEILHKQAERNIGVFKDKRQKCFAIESVCQDAAEFVFPPGPVFVFMYNPFWAELMERVLSNLKASLQADPRPAICVYYNPLSGHVVDKVGLFPHQREIPLKFEITRAVQRKAILYSTFPA
jgi:SAM-dependent methyltransferase